MNQTSYEYFNMMTLSSKVTYHNIQACLHINQPMTYVYTSYGYFSVGI